MPKTQQFSGITANGIIGRFFDRLESQMDKSWPSRLGFYQPSDQEIETYNWLGHVPGLREFVGGKQAKGLRENGISIRNKVFEATLGISVDDIRRDKTGQVMARVDELADRAVQHWASLLSTLILNGNGDTNGTCYDGQYFFDTDHSTGKSGTHKNLLTASEYGTLNVGTAAAPTPDEFAKALLDVIAHFFTFKDDAGEPFNENAMGFMVMTPVPLWQAAYQAVNSKFLSTGSGVRDNIFDGSQFSIEVVPNPRLTWTTDFAVFRTDANVKAFILQEEKAPEPMVLGEGSEHVTINREWLFSVEAIRNVGYGLWQHGIRATLS